MSNIFWKFHIHSTCFNGAAPARARNAKPQNGHPTTPSGFNGAAPARARNGPGHRRQRKHTRGFNGAAPARARNANAQGNVRSSTLRFNGAAPARARNDGLRVSAVSEVIALQRGRARAGAECAATLAAARVIARASTGPRPRGRGMLFWIVLQAKPDVASTGPRPRGRGMSARRGW